MFYTYSNVTSFDSFANSFLLQTVTYSIFSDNPEPFKIIVFNVIETISECLDKAI